MRFLLLCFALWAVICSVASQGSHSSCNRMHTHPKVARMACMASCNLQNCPTGNCQVRRGRKTCVCGRCGKGTNVSASDLLKLRKGRK